MNKDIQRILNINKKYPIKNENKKLDLKQQRAT